MGSDLGVFIQHPRTPMESFVQESCRVYATVTAHRGGILSWLCPMRHRDRRDARIYLPSINKGDPFNEDAREGSKCIPYSNAVAAQFIERGSW